MHFVLNVSRKYRLVSAHIYTLNITAHFMMQRNLQVQEQKSERRSYKHEKCL